MLTEKLNFLYIAFELTIFILLVIVLYKVIKDYLIPILYSEIEKIKQKVKELKDKKNLLNSSEKRIIEEINNQKSSFNILENKISVWKDNISLENKSKENFNEKLLTQIKNKRNIQSKNLSLLKTEKVVIPKAIQLAYEEITKKYSGKSSRKLLEELINKIN
jgi:predicted nuclease with TOPRIM domain